MQLDGKPQISIYKHEISIPSQQGVKVIKGLTVILKGISSIAMKVGNPYYLLSVFVVDLHFWTAITQANTHHTKLLLAYI